MLKKFIIGALVATVMLLLQGYNSVSATKKVSIGTYQCSVCGQISRVTTPNTVLGDYALDGHRHDWHYIGGLSGRINPIR